MIRITIEVDAPGATTVTSVPVAGAPQLPAQGVPSAEGLDAGAAPQHPVSGPAADTESTTPYATAGDVAAGSAPALPRTTP